MARKQQPNAIFHPIRGASTMKINFGKMTKTSVKKKKRNDLTWPKGQVCITHKDNATHSVVTA